MKKQIKNFSALLGLLLCIMDSQGSLAAVFQPIYSGTVSLGTEQHRNINLVTDNTESDWETSAKVKVAVRDKFSQVDVDLGLHRATAGRLTGACW